MYVHCVVNGDLHLYSCVAFYGSGQFLVEISFHGTLFLLTIPRGGIYLEIYSITTDAPICSSTHWIKAATDALSLALADRHLTTTTPRTLTCTSSTLSIQPSTANLNPHLHVLKQLSEHHIVVEHGWYFVCCWEFKGRRMSVLLGGGRWGERRVNRGTHPLSTQETVPRVHFLPLGRSLSVCFNFNQVASLSHQHSPHSSSALTLFQRRHPPSHPS